MKNGSIRDDQIYPICQRAVEQPSDMTLLADKNPQTGNRCATMRYPIGGGYRA